MEVSILRIVEKDKVYQPTSIRRGSRNSHLSTNVQTTSVSRELCLSFAHDFRNVLASIVLYSELLVSELQSDSELRQHAETITQAGGRGVQLIKELTASSFYSQATPSWEVVISEILNLLIPLLSPTVEIKTRLSQTPGVVRLDFRDTCRLILLLLSHTYYVMPAVRRITFSTRVWPRISDSVKESFKCNSQVEFVVTGTRTGMKREIPPSSIDCPVGSNSASGLTIVRNIVEGAGGEVKVVQISKGTKVSIRVPRFEINEV